MLVSTSRQPASTCIDKYCAQILNACAMTMWAPVRLHLLADDCLFAFLPTLSIKYFSTFSLFSPLFHIRFLFDTKHPHTQFGPSLPKRPTPGSLILDINVFFVCLFISCIYFCVWVGEGVSWRPLNNIPPLLCSGFPNLWQRDRSWLLDMYWCYCS